MAIKGSEVHKQGFKRVFMSFLNISHLQFLQYFKTF